MGGIQSIFQRQDSSASISSQAQRAETPETRKKNPQRDTAAKAAGDNIVDKSGIPGSTQPPATATTKAAITPPENSPSRAAPPPPREESKPFSKPFFLNDIVTGREVIARMKKDGLALTTDNYEKTEARLWAEMEK